SLQFGAQTVQEHINPAPDLDIVSGLTVDPGGASTLVGSDPVPCHDKERRITDEVEQVIEPATLVIASPTVQLGLNLQYPRLCLIEARPRRARVHERPLGVTFPLLRSRCRPSPRTQPACAPSTPPAPSRPMPTADDLPAHRRPGRMEGGQHRTVPTFTI